MKTPYSFIFGLVIPPGLPLSGSEQSPAIVLPDGSNILLTRYDAACRPRQYKRRAKRLPTLETRNKLGAAMVEALNATL